MAKFGIALEWGSRGLEFESRHSDQKAETVSTVSAFFFAVSLHIGGLKAFDVFYKIICGFLE